MGQSTKTMIAQIVAEQLGGAMERVVVTAGDSGKISMGFGGFNSRQAVMAGSSAHVAAIKVREKVLLVASHLLEVDASDLDIEGDHVVVKGAARMKISLGQIARTMAGAPGFVLPGNLAPGLEATENVVIDADDVRQRHGHCGSRSRHQYGGREGDAHRFRARRG